MTEAMTIQEIERRTCPFDMRTASPKTYMIDSACTESRPWSRGFRIALTLGAMTQWFELSLVGRTWQRSACTCPMVIGSTKIEAEGGRELTIMQIPESDHPMCRTVIGAGRSKNQWRRGWRHDGRQHNELGGTSGQEEVTKSGTGYGP